MSYQDLPNEELISLIESGKSIEWHLLKNEILKRMESCQTCKEMREEHDRFLREENLSSGIKQDENGNVTFYTAAYGANITNIPNQKPVIPEVKEFGEWCRGIRVANRVLTKEVVSNTLVKNIVRYCEIERGVARPTEDEKVSLTRYFRNLTISKAAHYAPSINKWKQ